MLIKRIQTVLVIILTLNMVHALDCPADSAYHIDEQIQLGDGSPNPNYGQLIATGLCACLDFGTQLEISDTTVKLTVIMVDNEPIRGVQMDFVHNAPGLLVYAGMGSIEKGEKLENVTDENGASSSMNLLANDTGDTVRVMAYSTNRAQTAGDGQVGTLFFLTYGIPPDGLASLPDSISFHINNCLLAGTSLYPPRNVICTYPDSLNPVSFEVTLGTYLVDSQLPTEFELNQNYPNPFNPSTKINFAIPEVSDVRLNIYNLLGQTVITLVEDQLAPGRYEIKWNGLDASNQQVASGVYFYELKTDKFIAREKMLFLR
ncbi:MAG: T9SS type A sorting domain-containing protein [Candidatus Marinimicrobia bacterium]|nr:T9SS type A sorting domain-containing protein [Candidatus Neomarinimicrobiota bacterium]